MENLTGGVLRQILNVLVLVLLMVTILTKEENQLILPFYEYLRRYYIVGIEEEITKGRGKNKKTIIEVKPSNLNEFYESLNLLLKY